MHALGRREPGLLEHTDSLTAQEGANTEKDEKQGGKFLFCWSLSRTKGTGGRDTRREGESGERRGLLPYPQVQSTVVSNQHPQCCLARSPVPPEVAT